MAALSRYKRCIPLVLCAVLTLCLFGCGQNDLAATLDSSQFSTGPVYNPGVEGVIISAGTDSFVIEITHINTFSKDPLDSDLFDTVKPGSSFTVYSAQLDVSTKLTAKIGRDEITNEDCINYVVMFHKNDVESFDDTTLNLKSLYVFDIYYSGEDE